MSARARAAASIALAGAALLYGCSGSDAGTGQDTSPTKPAGSSGASGSTSGTSGASGTSGTSGASGTSGTSGTSSGATDAGPDGPAQNCVPKGYAGNNKKIGAYCDKDVSCPFQLDPFLVCTYGHTDEPNLLFCTAPCSNDAECGTGAFCMKDPKGNGCVPAQCGGKPGS